ncbi:MAG: TetR/AcrR family transcriptional regulator [Desulfosalsimonas sp.]|uniref:TetR/AcrR family transcriptional regulator n=1 Tax=Desulfosalsimonas sp. TaxID=3073848 RepID=UPI003970EE22
MGRKQAIIESATRLFAQKGFAETSTAEIAEDAGVAHGTLFYHFKNKRGIIHEIFSIAGEVYLRSLKKVLCRQATGMAKIEALIRFNENYSRDHIQQIRIFQRFFPDPADDCDPEKMLLDSLKQQVMSLIKESLETGVCDGSIASVDIDKTAAVIHSLIFGITHMNLMESADTPKLTQGAIAFCRRALTPGGQDCQTV